MCAQMIHAYPTNDLTLQQTRLAACHERDVVINGMASTPPSALCGIVRSTRLGEVRRNRFGPLLARGRQCSRRDRLHHRRYALTENPYATKATSYVTQKTSTHQNGDSHPSTDKQSIHAFQTADLTFFPETIRRSHNQL